MAVIYAVANQKGGVGKTTTTVNVAACMANGSRRVLLVDLDPQGNATSAVGIDKLSLEATSYEMLLGLSEAKACILNLKDFHMDLIPANMDLTGAEVELNDLENKQMILDQAIRPLRENYDYILIDCPPSLSMLTINALCAADAVLVPLQGEYFALEGFSQLMNTVNLVKKNLNPKLEIEGVIFTMYDRTILGNQVIKEIERFLPGKAYHTRIPRNVRLGEAPSYGLPITYYDDRSKGAKSYRKLTEEILERSQKIHA